MSLGQIFDIAGSAMSAQTVRLNTHSINLANADSASSSIDRTYRARHPVFSAVQQQVMEQGLFGEAAAAQAGVEVAGIVESQAPLQPRYQPEHPMADQDGYVYYPNVNPIEEMADMISASRSYQVNVEMMNTAKEMIVQTLKLGG